MTQIYLERKNAYFFVFDFLILPCSVAHLFTTPMPIKRQTRIPVCMHERAKHSSHPFPDPTYKVRLFVDIVEAQENIQHSNEKCSAA